MRRPGASSTIISLVIFLAIGALAVASTAARRQPFASAHVRDDFDLDFYASRAAASSSSSSSSLANFRTQEGGTTLRRRSTENVAAIASPTTTCGNGLVEPGEECDPAEPIHGQCCDDTCRRRADTKTSCTGVSNSEGVCQAGRCLSREGQCARFDDQTMLGPNFAIRGPYTPCSSATGASGTRKIFESVQNQCTLACHGAPASSGADDVCVDMSRFAKVGDVVVEATVPDGLVCGADATSSPLGLCIGGACVNVACRRLQCGNHGDCIRASGGALKCSCDSGFFGDSCNKQEGCDGTVDSCGVCNGKDDTCSQDIVPVPFIQSTTFRYIVLPIGVTLTVVILALLALLAIRRKRNSSDQLGVLTSHYFKSKVPHRLGISVSWDEYQCIHPYEAGMPDELDLQEGDILFKLFEYDDGWAKGYNTRTQEEGIYPTSFTEKVDGQTEMHERRSTSMVASTRKDSNASSKRLSYLSRKASSSSQAVRKPSTGGRSASGVPKF